ncbi:hypothetical protein CIB95_09075 [Lottiidibacillus patelloidae]|uniref:Uncharacterized protein n=1 Tax=Lottiidibacillus patelloidae TaxID=2670334 RepID=A0A263BTM6_9BACI|nr:hypothetical protein [Lottiidibacillus patelloidae]OZM56912.1 hypothetical protein CIB95_09075 [Lottiidibacillus patelloidae]
MKWNEVRKQFPNRCVLVESLKANKVGKEKVIEDMSVISNFTNGNDAWKEYRKLHRKYPTRELYIFHTNNDEVKVIEQQYVGVRRKI